MKHAFQRSRSTHASNRSGWSCSKRKMNCCRTCAWAAGPALSPGRAIPSLSSFFSYLSFICFFFCFLSFLCFFWSVFCLSLSLSLSPLLWGCNPREAPISRLRMGTPISLHYRCGIRVMVAGETWNCNEPSHRTVADEQHAHSPWLRRLTLR